MKPEMKEESDSEMDAAVEPPTILKYGLRDLAIDFRDLALTDSEIEEIVAERTMEGKQIKNGFFWFDDFKSYVLLVGGHSIYMPEFGSMITMDRNYLYDLHTEEGLEYA